jgi:chromosome segregation ATPase
MRVWEINMQQSADKNWSALHRRRACGETLSAQEQADYDAICRQMDAQEHLDGNLARLRELRLQIAQAKAEQQQLQTQEDALDARISDLEARLDARTRQLLGIAS